MRNQVTEGTKTPERNTWRGFITRVKDPATVVAAMVTLVLAFGGGVMTGTVWFVTPEVEALRGELTGEIKTTKAELAALRNQIGTSNKGTESRTTALDGEIGENNRRISDNGERIAHMESKFAETTARLDRMHTQVTKNSELITDLRLRGTPDVKVGGTPD